MTSSNSSLSGHESDLEIANDKINLEERKSKIESIVKNFQFKPTQAENEAMLTEALSKLFLEEATSSKEKPKKNPKIKQTKIKESAENSSLEDEPDEGIKDLKLLQSMIHKRFTGKTEELNTFLDQIHNAYQLCHEDKRKQLLMIIFNEIEGEPREKLRENPNVDSYKKLRKFLLEHYKIRESFAQAYSNLGSAKQNPNENSRQYGDRIQNLAYRAKLTSKKEKGLTAEAATQMVNFLALERFKIGSKTEISRFICCNPYATTLTESIQLAIDFETKEIQENEKNEQTRRTKFCTFCRTSTHTTNECRSKKPKNPTSKECSY